MKNFITPPRSEIKSMRKVPKYSVWRSGELISNRWFVHKALPPSNMSILYFCFDTKLGRPMVVKSLPPQYLNDLTSKKRFISECEIWIQLGNHANIAEAYFVENLNDYPFVFIEWVNGKDIYNSGLTSWIGTPILSIDLIIKIVMQICDGLIHATNILGDDQIFVHRDIKPSNILVTYDWEVKITDFGISITRFLTSPKDDQLKDIKNSDESSKDKDEFTKFLGTPPYMSPEHFTKPLSLDVRSDIYSLGCTIYEMITGEYVFNADSWIDWQEAHINQQAPRLKDMRPNVPTNIDELVAACLAKDPSERPQDFTSIKEILDSKKIEIAIKKELKKADKVEELSKEKEDEFFNRFSKLMDKGTSLDSLGKPKEAISYFEEADKILKPLDDSIHKHTSKFMLFCNKAVAYEHLKNYEASLSYWDQAVDIAEKIPDGYRGISSSLPLKKTSALLGKILTLVEKGELDKAKEICKEVISLEPNNQIALSRMGYLLVCSEQYEEAIIYCNRALQIDERDMHSLANLGAALLAIGEIEKARSTLGKTLSLSPAHPPALYSMGTLLLQENDFEKAIECLKKAVTVNSNYSEAWNHLGIAMYKAGKSDWEDCFANALRTDPKNTAAFANFVGLIRQRKGCTAEEAFSLVISSIGINEQNEERSNLDNELNKEERDREQHRGYFVFSSDGPMLSLNISLMQDPEYLIAKGTAEYQKQNLKSAVNYFKKALKKNDNLADAYCGLGACAYASRDFDSALKKFQIALDKSNKHLPTLWNLSFINNLFKNFYKALNFCNQLLEIDDSFSQFWSLKACIQINLLKYDDSIISINHAISMNPDDFKNWLYKGYALMVLKKFKQAIICFDKGLSIASDERLSIHYKGLTYLQMKEYQKAQSCFKKVLQLDPNYIIENFYMKYINLTNFALVSREESKLMRKAYYASTQNKAIAYLDRALEKDPRNLDAWYNKGISLYYLKRFDESLACFDKATGINPGLATAWTNKGECYLKFNKFDKAKECFEIALQLKPNLDNAQNGYEYCLTKAKEFKNHQVNELDIEYYNKGCKLMELKEWNSAIEYFNKVLKLNPKNDDAIYNKGVCLQNQENFNEAVECFYSVLSLSPLSIDALSNRGACFLILREYENALSDFSRIIEINPKIDFAWYHKGICHALINQKKEAKKCIKKAIRINSKIKIYHDALKKMDSQ